MSNRIKKMVCWCILATWGAFFAVWGAEAFEKCQDTPEHADQGVERVLFAPADRADHVSDGLTERQTFPTFCDAAAVDAFHAPRAVFRGAPPAVARGAPPGLKLHQLFSVYLL